MLRAIHCVIETPKGFYTPKGKFVEEGDDAAIFVSSVAACRAAYALKCSGFSGSIYIHVLPLLFSRGETAWFLEK